MNKADVDTDAFATHYKTLGLDQQANWDTLRVSYRHRVNIWHPDRFVSKPREQAHAQQQFIELTKSYRALRAFYQKNQRLPFQSAHKAQGATESNDTQNHSGIHNNHGTKHTSDFDEHILSSATKPDKSANKRSPKTIWTVITVVIVTATFVLFFILDHRATQATLEKGKAIVEQTPPSDFMPSHDEIRKHEAKGAFIKQTQ